MRRQTGKRSVCGLRRCLCQEGGQGQEKGGASRKDRQNLNRNAWVEGTLSGRTGGWAEKSVDTGLDLDGTISTDQQCRGHGYARAQWQGRLAQSEAKATKRKEKPSQESLTPAPTLFHPPQGPDGFKAGGINLSHPRGSSSCCNLKF